MKIKISWRVQRNLFSFLSEMLFERKRKNAEWNLWDFEETNFQIYTVDFLLCLLFGDLIFYESVCSKIITTNFVPSERDFFNKIPPSYSKSIFSILDSERKHFFYVLKKKIERARIFAYFDLLLVPFQVIKGGFHRNHAIFKASFLKIFIWIDSFVPSIKSVYDSTNLPYPLFS